MIILATPFSIYSIRGKCLMGIKMGGKKLLALTHFKSKQFPKPSPQLLILICKMP